MAILGLLAVTGSLAAGAWFMKGRPADPAPATEAESPEASEAVLAEPTTAEASVESTQPEMAETPVSTEESAEAWPPAEESAQEVSFTQPSSETPSPAAPSAEEASDFDRLKAKSERWRERYQSIKAEVDRLQAEVAKLEEETKNTLVGGLATEWIGGQLVVKTPDPTSQYKSSVERNRERLPVARGELANAKAALAAIEEAARRDGVASGQLY
jgi:hypothetical protein